MKNKNTENEMGNKTCSSLMVLMIAAFFLISACFAGFTYAENDSGGVKITEVPSPQGVIKIFEIPGPDGTTKITEIPGPDGVTKITNLPSGANITNLPSGANITNLPGGTNITNLPSGANITDLSDGTTVTTFPDGTKALKRPGGGLWNRLVEGMFSIIYGVVIFGVLISVVFFAVGFKTKNNLFYIAGAGTLLLTGALYFSTPSYEIPEIPSVPAEPVRPPMETLSPLSQLELLLANADKNKNSGDVAAEKLELLKALDITLKNNILEKKELIETKLSGTTRREASDHRRSGNPGDAVKSVDESINYDSVNPWAYVEGIINSEELENHGGAIQYANELAGIDLTPGAVTSDFPPDTQTVNEYKNYAAALNNNGTSVAKTAETMEDISDMVAAVKTGAEYISEALAISGALDLSGAGGTLTGTVVSNLVSANNNLIVLQTQAGDFNSAKDAASDTLKIIGKYPGFVSDSAKSGVLSNTATVHALAGDYTGAIDYANRSLLINQENAGANNVIASSLTAIGGERNVRDALTYAQRASDIDSGNKIYNDNLNTIKDAVANNDWYGIELNLGVNVVGVHENLITCCLPGGCVKATEEKCSGIGGAVMECIPEMPSGASLAVPAAPQNFTPLNVSRYPGWWRNLTAAVNESSIVRDNWTYDRSLNRTCMEFANNLTEYLRSRGFNATFTTYQWENDTNPGNSVPGHAVSDVYAPGGEKVFIEPQWAKSEVNRMNPPTIPDHYLANGTRVPSGSGSGMDADSDGAVEAKNGQHSNAFAPTDDNVMIEQYQSRSAAGAAGVPGA